MTIRIPLVSDREKQPEEDAKPKTAAAAEPPCKKPQETVPPRRFISSILGGDVPYGSRGHVLTRAERKEYAPIVPPDKVTLPVTKKPPEDTPKPQNLAPVRQFSVIQRTPKTTKRDEDKEAKLSTAPLVMQEPEQEQPIDYHIPKRRGETEDENEEKKIREQRRSHCSKVSKPLISVRAIVGKLPVTMSAAAGHGRGSSGNQSAGNQSTNSSAGGGGTINFSGGSSGGSSGGTIGGGTGGGGMNPGRDGRQNYGPSSPPTGSLPPFYESLKSGNNGNNYNASGNFSSNYLINNGNQHNMECDTGQELANLSLNGGQSPPKQYSTLQNASYGIVMKDEADLDLYEGKLDAMNQLLPGSYTGYDDSMMVDMVTGDGSRPLAVHRHLDILHFGGTRPLGESLGCRRPVHLPPTSAQRGQRKRRDHHQQHPLPVHDLRLFPDSTSRPESGLFQRPNPRQPQLRRS
jgi:ovo-like protein